VQKSPVAQAMRAKLDSEEGRAVYAQRKAVVEPVFGQVKEIRGFRRVSLRGRELVSEEWRLICLTHNPAQALPIRSAAGSSLKGRGRGASAARSTREGDPLRRA
jgi:Transposase DDE domain